MISYQIGQIADCVAKLHQVQAQTVHNHQMSLQTVTRNAENLGGSASQAFQDAINQVNHRYQIASEKLKGVAIALNVSSDEFSTADAACAAKYC
jgi:uncharacterized protein YukE